MFVLPGRPARDGMSQHLRQRSHFEYSDTKAISITGIRNVMPWSCYPCSGDGEANSRQVGASHSPLEMLCKRERGLNSSQQRCMLKG